MTWGTGLLLTDGHIFFNTMTGFGVTVDAPMYSGPIWFVNRQGGDR